MEYFNELTAVAATVVLFVTQAMKYIPVAWTTRYAVWVNIALSFIGAVVTMGVPTFTIWLDFVVQWLIIALVAALAYNQLLKHAVANPGEPRT